MEEHLDVQSGYSWHFTKGATFLYKILHKAYFMVKARGLFLWLIKMAFAVQTLLIDS